MHLLCKFVAAAPLFHKSTLCLLREIINESLPEWSMELRVAECEDSEGLFIGRAGDIGAAIQEIATPRYGMGTAILTGAYEGLSIFVDHCEAPSTVGLNNLAVEVYQLNSVDHQPTSEWARQFFAAVPECLPIDYARSNTRQEFDAKNIISERNGIEAIGVNLTRHLPGLYWLNYLGPPYVDLIGIDRLLSAPAYEVKEVSGGVLLALAADADEWQSAEYQAREAAVIEHIGRQYFFSRWDPDRKTVAPEFRAFRQRHRSE
jgi:hypothetical protein